VVGLQLLGEGVQALLAAGDQDEVDAAGGELAGELLADAAAGSGDQGGRARFDLHHGFLFECLGWGERWRSTNSRTGTPAMAPIWP